MNLSSYLPIYNRLALNQQQVLERTVTIRTEKKGRTVYDGTTGCEGLLLVINGRLRAYVLSDEGKEITLYRLLPRDICLFSASCIMNSIQFDIIVEAEEDTEFFHIPALVYKQLMKESLEAANYTNEIMAARFSDVMWQMDQIINKRMDSRLAAFLLLESQLTDSDKLTITHETIAKHLSSAREVISRMLKYFEEEAIVSLSRGEITITDKSKLYKLAEGALRQKP